jgi:hypothetical protein
MLGDVLLKLVSVVTPDDVREMVRLGLRDNATEMVNILEEMAMRWQSVEYGHLPVDDWSVVRIKLDELRAALRG